MVDYQNDPETSDQMIGQKTSTGEDANGQELLADEPRNTFMRVVKNFSTVWYRNPILPCFESF